MQELQRTPLAEEVGILAAGDLALRFVEWFGFEELARTGWREQTLARRDAVFAPPRRSLKCSTRKFSTGSVHWRL